MTSVPTITDVLELLRIDVEPESAMALKRDTEDTTCSKNVLRKQRHWARRLSAKKGKRKEEKQKRKLNRLQESGPEVDGTRLSKRVVKAITKERLTEARDTGPKLCIDLSMTDCMSQKETSRLAGQIRRLYGSNRRASRPFHLFLTGLRADSQLYEECLRMNDGFLSYVMDFTEASCLDLFPAEDVIYLTPDAEEALAVMEEDKVYVLGGLVDESIQKKRSYLRAREGSVRASRLPIDEYMVKRANPKNFHSKVLAINQVFDVLVAFRDTGSWTWALAAGVPAGKGYAIATETAPEARR